MLQQGPPAGCRRRGRRALVALDSRKRSCSFERSRPKTLSLRCAAPPLDVRRGPEIPLEIVLKRSQSVSWQTSDPPRRRRHGVTTVMESKGTFILARLQKAPQNARSRFILLHNKGED